MFKLRLICLVVLFNFNILILEEKQSFERKEMPEEMMLKLMDDKNFKRAYEISHAPKELADQYEIYERALPESIIKDFQMEDSFALCDNIDAQNAITPLTNVLDNETTEARHKRYMSVVPENIKAKMKPEDITATCEKIDKEVFKKKSVSPIK